MDKNLDLSRNLKRRRNMKVKVISIIVGTVPKGLEKRLEELEIKGRTETIQTTALLKPARIFKRVLETVGDLLHSDFSEKILVKRVKISHRVKKKFHFRIKIEIFLLIGLMGRVFANGPGDMGSILGHVIPKTLKMVLDTSLLNTQQYKVRIKGKVEQLRERSSALPYTSV